MSSLAPFVVEKIDKHVREMVAQVKSGKVPLRFVGALQDGTWRSDAAKTVDAAIKLFVPGGMKVDPETIRELLRELHLKDFTTTQMLPIKAVLEGFAASATATATPVQPRPASASGTFNFQGLTRTATSTGKFNFQTRPASPTGGFFKPEDAQKTLTAPEAKPELKRTLSAPAVLQTPPPPSLKPMLDLIKHGLIEKHPAIVEFLRLVLEAIESLDPATQQAFKSYLQGSQRVKKLVHVTYLLDMLVVSMTNSKEFTFELQNHLYKQLNAVGINPFSSIDTFKGIVGLQDSTLFQGLKTISVFPAVTMLLVRRFNGGQAPTDQQIEAVAGRLSWADMKALKMTQSTSADGEDTGMLINVTEAVMADYNDGRKDNAAVGAIYCIRCYGGQPGASGKKDDYPEGWVFPTGLKAAGDATGVAHPFYEAMLAEIKKLESVKVDGKAVAKNYHSSSYDDDWASLYHTWNFAFILAEMPDLDVIAPKLLVPSVMCAKGEQYLFARVHALWAAICFYALKKADRKHNNLHPPAHTAFAQLFGAINLEQAWLYLKKRPECRYATKAELVKKWDETAPSLVQGGWGFARLAAHALFGRTNRLL